MGPSIHRNTLTGHGFFEHTGSQQVPLMQGSRQTEG